MSRWAAIFNAIPLLSPAAVFKCRGREIERFFAATASLAALSGTAMHSLSPIEFVIAGAAAALVCVFLATRRNWWRIHRKAVFWGVLQGLSAATLLSWGFGPAVSPWAVALSGISVSVGAVRMFTLPSDARGTGSSALADCLQSGIVVGLGLGVVLGEAALRPIDGETGNSDAAGASGSLYRSQTDAGRPVSLWVNAETAMSCSPDEELTEIHRAGLEGLVTRSGPIAAHCNCHGWVFAGGRGWISTDDARTILADNGYEPVCTPEPGDLVVYRYPSGAVCHTGVVRLAAPVGGILVESKWGKLGSFLHRPEDQIYSQDWGFYHTCRGGHLLRELPDQPVGPPGGNSAAVAPRRPGPQEQPGSRGRRSGGRFDH